MDMLTMALAVAKDLEGAQDVEVLALSKETQAIRNAYRIAFDEGFRVYSGKSYSFRR